MSSILPVRHIAGGRPARPFPARVRGLAVAALGTLCGVALLLPTVAAHAETPSCDTVCANRARLIARAEQNIADAEAANAAVTITQAKITDATLVLDPSTASFTLDPTGATIPVETTTVTDDVTLVTLVSDLLFAFDSADLTPAAQAKIIELVTKIPQGADVAVDGYTDSLGDEAYNLDLSQRRAEAVAAVIRDQRPDLALTVTGHGAADPVAPNTTSDGADDPAGRAQNRRVTVSYGG